MEPQVNVGAANQQMDPDVSNPLRICFEQMGIGGIMPNAPLTRRPIARRPIGPIRPVSNSEEEVVIRNNILPMPIPPPQNHTKIPLRVARAEADEVMEVFPDLEKDFLIKHARRNSLNAQEIIQQLTFGTIQAPKRHSPGRIHDVSLESLDDEGSVDFSANEISEKESAYNEAVKQQLLQRLEADLKIAYTELRNNTLANRFKFLKGVDRNYMKMVAPNLYVDKIETVMEYALTAENGFLAVLLLSWFEEKNTPDLVRQLFVSQMKTVRTPIVERRENKSQLLTKLLNSCYKQTRAKPRRDFETPPPCFQKIVALVREMLEKPKAMFECEICADEKPVAESVKCEPLSGEDEGNEHKFCIDCVKRYVESSVSQPNVTPGGEGLRCMQPGCEGIFKHAVVISCIPKDQKQTRRLLEKRLSMAAIIASGIPSEECQFCSYAQVIEEPADVNKVFDCRKCKAEFCRICKKLWSIHIGKKCHEVVDEEMTAEERARVKLEEELSKLSIRYCQHCNIAFEKTSGCNKMTCRCGRKQCYLCNMPINDYDHFCPHPTDPKRPGVCPQKCGKCMLWADLKAQEVKERKKLIDSYKGQISDDNLRLYKRFRRQTNHPSNS